MTDNGVALRQRVKIDGRIIRQILVHDFEVEIGSCAVPGDSRSF